MFLLLFVWLMVCLFVLFVLFCFVLFCFFVGNILSSWSLELCYHKSILRIDCDVIEEWVLLKYVTQLYMFLVPAIRYSPVRWICMTSLPCDESCAKQGVWPRGQKSAKSVRLKFSTMYITSLYAQTLVRHNSLIKGLNCQTIEIVSSVCFLLFSRVSCSKLITRPD